MAEHSASTNPSLAREIIEQLDELLRDAEVHSKPLEVDPMRSRLFELFVSAEGAGYLSESSAHDLSADGLCHTLSERWGLRASAQSSVAHDQKLNPQDLNKMRLLWSLMRMWMEWDYAWTRWTEFHETNDADE